MKFVMDKAWEEALGLLKGNFGLLATVAGVLVFLPTVISNLIMPSSEFEKRVPQGDNPSMEQLSDVFRSMVADYWWLFAITIMISIFANLALIALMRRRSTPTVGEAMSEAASAWPTALGVMIIAMAAYAALAVLLIGLPALVSPALSVLGILILLPVFMYLVIKWSVASPVIMIEGVRNPVEALRRSWWLTKGNSGRLFLYYVLLGIAFAVVIAIVGMIVGVILALMPASLAAFGTAAYEAALGMVASIVGAAIAVAIHAQLKRLRDRAAEPVDETPDA